MIKTCIFIGRSLRLNRNLLNKIKKDSFSYGMPNLKKSDDFVGVYLHSNSPFTRDDHEAPIRNFRIFSQYWYPLYFFIDEASITDDFVYIYNNYGPFNVIRIPNLKNSFEYNYYFFNKLFRFIDKKYNFLFTFQDDGFCISSGWEEFITTNDFDYIGAPFRARINVLTNDGELNIPKVGNGGVSIRKLSSILKVIDYVDSKGGQLQYFKGIKINDKLMQNNGWLAEDAMFCSVGFSLGMFKPITLAQAAKFALEPISYRMYCDKKNKNRPYNFHKIDN